VTIEAKRVYGSLTKSFVAMKTRVEENSYTPSDSTGVVFTLRRGMLAEVQEWSQSDASGQRYGRKAGWKVETRRGWSSVKPRGEAPEKEQCSQAQSGHSRCSQERRRL